MKKVTLDDEVFCQNRKARHEYSILDTLEAGICLIGAEIKSIRDHRMSLDGSYARVIDGEVWLIGANIDPYKNTELNAPKRDRKLLLNKKEIQKFAEKADEKGRTLVPLKAYSKGGRCKIELAVCEGKQEHDKRQTIKERDAQREIRQQ